MMLATAVHGYSAYSVVSDMDGAARLEQRNPLVLFDEVTTNGVQVNSAIDARARGAYTQALNQFVLDGTGVCLAIVLIGGGAFLRLSR